MPEQKKAVKPPSSQGAPPGPVDEEAHFRIDEQARRLQQLEQATSPEVVAAIVTGVVTAVQAQMRSEGERIMKAVNAGSEGERAVVAALRELIDTLRTPVERTSTINLPSGQVTMKIDERRGAAA